MTVTLKAVPIEKPEDVNLILGQAHFIKTVEDLHEALVTAVPGIRFGLAFCEASGPCLVRWSGTDETLVAAARTNTPKPLARAVARAPSAVQFALSRLPSTNEVVCSMTRAESLK